MWSADAIAPPAVVVAVAVVFPLCVFSLSVLYVGVSYQASPFPALPKGKTLHIRLRLLPHYQKRYISKYRR